jgi:hypothetical protein
MTHSIYPFFDLTFTASQDMSEDVNGGNSYQYYLVELTPGTVGSVQLHTSANTYAIGVLRNKPIAGDTAVVRVMGVSELACYTDGTDPISYGSVIGPYINTTPNGLGAVVSATSTQVFGRCLDVSGAASGSYITCALSFVPPATYVAPT